MNIESMTAAAIHPEMHLRIKRALNGLAPAENHDRIIDRLASEGAVRTYMPGEYHASAADQKKLRLEKLDSAMASETPAVKSAAVLLSSMLARGGLTRTDVEGGLATIDAAFSKSKLTVDERLQAKSLLFRLGVIS